MKISSGRCLIPDFSNVSRVPVSHSLCVATFSFTISLSSTWWLLPVPVLLSQKQKVSDLRDSFAAMYRKRKILSDSFCKREMLLSFQKPPNISYYHVSSDWVTHSSLSQSLKSVKPDMNFDWSQYQLTPGAKGEDIFIYTIWWRMERLRIF